MALWTLKVGSRREVRLNFQYFSEMNNWNKPKMTLNNGFLNLQEDFLITYQRLKPNKPRYSWEFIKMYKSPLPPFVKQKSNVMILWLPLATLKLNFNWVVEGNLDFLQKSWFSFKTLIKTHLFLLRLMIKELEEIHKLVSA